MERSTRSSFILVLLHLFFLASSSLHATYQVFGSGAYYNTQFANSNSPVQIDHSVYGSLGLSTTSEQMLRPEFLLHALMANNGSLAYSVESLSLELDLEPVQFRMGRFPLQWSPLEKNWGLGNINNRRNFNLVEPDSEGLTGLLVKMNLKSFVSLQGFYSPLAVPELNPVIKEKNGKLISKSKWAAQYPTQNSIEPNGELFPIRYVLHQPNIKNLIYNQSLGAALSFNNSFLESNTYFLQKPENTLRTFATISTNSSLGAIVADIYPELYKEKVFGSALTFYSQENSLTLEYISIDPENTPTSSERVKRVINIEKNKNKEEYALAHYRWKNSNTWGNFNVQLGFLQSLMAKEEEQTTLGNKLRWTQAWQQSMTWSGLGGVSIKEKLFQDISKKDLILDTEIAWMIPETEIELLAGVLLLTSEKETSYWAPFRANDTFRLGIRSFF